MYQYIIDIIYQTLKTVSNIKTIDIYSEDIVNSEGTASGSKPRPAVYIDFSRAYPNQVIGKDMMINVDVDLRVILDKIPQLKATTSKVKSLSNTVVADNIIKAMLNLDASSLDTTGSALTGLVFTSSPVFKGMRVNHLGGKTLEIVISLGLSLNTWYYNDYETESVILEDYTLDIEMD